VSSDLWKKIDTFQRASLSRQLRRARVDPQEFIEISSASINRSHELQGPSSVPPEVAFPLRTDEDFWAYRNREAMGSVALAAECVDVALRAGELSEFDIRLDEVIGQLAQAGITTPGRSLKDAVIAIPRVSLWDPIYNALASRGSYGLNVPHIRTYVGAERISQMTSKLLINHGFTLPDSGGPLVLAEPSEHLSVPLALDTLVNHAASGQLMVPQELLEGYREVSTSVEIQYVSSVVAQAAKLVIILHEVGHHILGHLNPDQIDSDGIEEEADRFATQCLAGRFESDTFKTAAVLMGAEIPFLLMAASRWESVDSRYLAAPERAQQVRDLRHRRSPYYWAIFDYLLLPLELSIAHRLGRQDVRGDYLQRAVEYISHLSENPYHYPGA
jgi:hypothetical protein